jgi:hypothetical protein
MDLNQTSAFRLVALGGLLVLAAVWAQPAAAQWVWRDAQRQMHSSDLPPPKDIPDRDIISRPSARPAASAPAVTAPVATPAAAAPASSASSPLQAEVEARRAKAEQEAKLKRDEEAKAQAAARSENCRNARRELAALDSGQRMVRLNDKGEREYLDDKARAESTQRARSVISSDCGS